ncbi:MAG: hypothetical protein A2132_06975 [Nitrospirae bacterium RBG_16_43_11]|nr:MAG: hypothetical protein A2132_06975 [Nitrospirae bacterium RBG_16_43_11]
MVLHTFDIIALIFFVSCTLLYHAYYYSKVARLPRHIFKGKINIIRRTWVENMLKPGQALTAVQSLRNIHMAASFLASSSIVFIGSIIYLIFNIEQTSGIVTGRGTIALPDYLLFLKLLALMIMFLLSLLNFTLCIRLLNYLVILIGASQETIEDTMKMSAVDYITKMFSTAGIHYTFGIRGFYYTIPLIGWFLGTWLFIALTIIVLFLCLRLDYGK